MMVHIFTYSHAQSRKKETKGDANHGSHGESQSTASGVKDAVHDRDCDDQGQRVDILHDIVGLFHE